MVDGLAKIADPEIHRGLSTKLANTSARPGPPYRMIATTRPLPAWELAQQPSGRWPARRYELLRFTAEDRGVGFPRSGRCAVRFQPVRPERIPVPHGSQQGHSG